MSMRRIVLAAVVAAPLAWAPAPLVALEGSPQAGSAAKQMPQKATEKRIPPGIARNYPDGELPPGIARTRTQEPTDEAVVEEATADTTSTEECVPTLGIGDSISLTCGG